MNVPWGSGEFRRVLVYGLEKSGTAAARFLLDRGVEVLGVDRKPASEITLGSLTANPGFSTLASESEALEGLPVGLDGVVVSPGVPLDRPLLRAARAAGLPVIGEVELAFPFLDGPVVAITGSNGKSTTTLLAGEMLAASGRDVVVCGNIGTPICSTLSDAAETSRGRTYVIELSSFQIESLVHFRADAAALLNVAEDHLDRYPSFASYGDAKRALFRQMLGSDIAVLNADDPETLAVATAARRRTFSRLSRASDGCHLEDGAVVEIDPDLGRTELFEAREVRLAGVHNLENAMAAALLARALGAGPAALSRALASFRGLPHRLERVAEKAGVVWFDDSKGTNPAATAKSLEGFGDASVHLILGGLNKGADFSVLAPLVRAKAVRLYLIGKASEELAQALAGTAPIERSENLANAVEAAAANARQGENVVLSPACASFDQFQNFEDRGRQFQALVHRVSDAPPATGSC